MNFSDWNLDTQDKNLNFVEEYNRINQPLHLKWKTLNDY